MKKLIARSAVMAIAAMLAMPTTMVSAQTAGTVILTPQAAPATMEPNIFVLFHDIPTVKVGNVTAQLDVTRLCATPTTAFEYVVGGQTIQMSFSNGRLRSGKKSVEYTCPTALEPADEYAATFTAKYFTDRRHDQFFSETDRDTGMLPAIASGLKLTGPEFFDGYTVHRHDGAAIVKAFVDSRVNIMAYRFKNDRRAYIAIPRTAMSCGNQCTVGGADLLFLHASKKQVKIRRVEKPHVKYRVKKRRVETRRMRWVPIEHRWSMARVGGPWGSGSIRYNTWKSVMWKNGKKRRCRGGSKSRNINRACWELRPY